MKKEYIDISRDPADMAPPFVPDVVQVLCFIFLIKNINAEVVPTDFPIPQAPT